MSSQVEILHHAVEVLRRGGALTMDAVAREAGLTRPGVLHHFASKEALTVAVVDHIVDLWEEDLRKRARSDDSALGRLRSYVDFALTAEFDASDLALLADVRLRDRLCARWIEQLDPWLGWNVNGPAAQRAGLRAARLLADEAWMNSALGISTVHQDERENLHAIALGLIDDSRLSEEEVPQT